jgi:hypothetical protein
MKCIVEGLNQESLHGFLRTYYHSLFLGFRFRHEMRLAEFRMDFLNVRIYILESVYRWIHRNLDSPLGWGAASTNR